MHMHVRPQHLIQTLVNFKCRVTQTKYGAMHTREIVPHLFDRLPHQARDIEHSIVKLMQI